MNRFVAGDLAEQGEPLAEYRPVSFSAVAALLLAWPGLLGVFHPAFLVFPVLSLLLAAVALRQIATTSFAMSGRRAAQIAIVAALFATALTLGLHTMNSRREYRFALDCTERWLRLLRGENPREAYLLTMTYNLRPVQQGEDVPFAIRNSNRVLLPESEMAFDDQPAIKVLSDTASSLRYLGLVRTERGKDRASYRFVYDVHAPRANPNDFYAVIETQRLRGPDGVHYWQVGSWEMIAKNLGKPTQ